jgi:hypothetical protein
MASMNFWTPDRDELLLDLWKHGADPEDIAKHISTLPGEVDPRAVVSRARLLGYRGRRTARSFWTPEREAKLRELWVRIPRLKLPEIVAAFDGEIGSAYVSLHARSMGLPSRQPGRGDWAPERKRPSRVGEHCAPAASAKPHALPALEAPCPFYLGHGETCGVMVNRRRDSLGNRPSQYCAEHGPRVAPLSRGSIGTVATYAKGHRFG